MGVKDNNLILWRFTKNLNFSWGREGHEKPIYRGDYVKKKRKEGGGGFDSSQI